MSSSRGMSWDEQPASRFLSIAKEVRAIIYEECFSNEMLDLQRIMSSPRRHHRATASDKLPILLSCRQVFTEALQFFYQSHAFRFALNAEHHFFKGVEYCSWTEWQTLTLARPSEARAPGLSHVSLFYRLMVKESGDRFFCWHDMPSAISNSIKDIRKNVQSLKCFTIELSTETDLELDRFYIDYTGGVMAEAFCATLWSYLTEFLQLLPHFEVATEFQELSRITDELSVVVLSDEKYGGRLRAVCPTILWWKVFESKGFSVYCRKWKRVQER